MLTGEPVGGMFFNLILLGYGLPAVLMGVLARTVRKSRPEIVYVVAAITAIVLALAYLTLEVRTLFHGAVLTVGPTTDAEQYAYSAVWLAFGVALLLGGIDIRFAAGAACFGGSRYPDDRQGLPVRPGGGSGCLSGLLVHRIGHRPDRDRIALPAPAVPVAATNPAGGRLDFAASRIRRPTSAPFCSRNRARGCGV